jgi:hypothetical protein
MKLSFKLVLNPFGKTVLTERFPVVVEENGIVAASTGFALRRA